MKEDGGQAFPSAVRSVDTAGHPVAIMKDGMTLRDYLAAHCPVPLGKFKDWEEDAKARYVYADAMIAERSKK